MVSMPPLLAAACLGLGLGLAAPVALALACGPAYTDPCRLTVGPVTFVFGAGSDSFAGGAQLTGGDGFVREFADSYAGVPTLLPWSDGQHFGFSLAPGMEAGVGGSGIAGEHEATAWLAITELSLEAAPGWVLLGQALGVNGTRRTVGNGAVHLHLPGPPQFSGDDFVAWGLAPLDNTTLSAMFMASTIYEESDEGEAASYGTAYVRFDEVRFAVLASPVPEPGGTALMVAGLAALLLRRRRP